MIHRLWIANIRGLEKVTIRFDKNFENSRHFNSFPTQLMLSDIVI